jgi:tetratricopeptide (TPR) repeat protein
MKLLRLIVLCAWLLSGPAAIAGEGGTDSPFGLGAGARDLSLSGSSLAQCDPATSPYWNPSRLPRVERLALTGFHSRLFDADVSYNYLGVVVPTLDLGTFGLGIFRLGVDGIEQRSVTNFFEGYTRDSRLAFYLGYGIDLSGFDLGASASLETHSLAEYSATSSPGVDLSVGRSWEPSATWLRTFTFAANLRQLIQRGMRLDEQTVKQPRELNFGVGLDIIPRTSWQHVLGVHASVTKVEKVDPRWAAGLEYNMRDLLFLRGGVQDSKLSAGVGLSYRGVTFDYGVLDRDLGSIHMFTVTTSFGKPMSERRRARSAQREAEFNQLMRDRLAYRNQEMVASLVVRGDELLQAGHLDSAHDHFDRALFLARSSGMDTTAIAQRAAETQAKIARQTRQSRLAGLLDSARVHLAAKDYLAARYFAQRALGVDANAAAAVALLDQANAALMHSAERDRMLEEGLLAVDSLLSYGRLERAAKTVVALKELAPKDPRVAAAAKRTEFERWRAVASAAFADSDWPATDQALDSALAIFPGHAWCADMKGRVARELKPRQAPATATPQAGATTLTPELRGQVSALYDAARKAFERGDLNDAISRWDRVEQLAPDYESVRDYLIRAYKFVGVELYGHNQLDAAIAAWSKASRLDPNNAEIANYIRRTETELRKLRELSYEQ